MIAKLAHAHEDTVRDVVHRSNEIGLSSLDHRDVAPRVRLLAEALFRTRDKAFGPAIDRLWPWRRGVTSGRCRQLRSRMLRRRPGAQRRQLPVEIVEPTTVKPSGSDHGGHDGSAA
ncbi:hypothetical protein [Streptomyces longisporus]|uniref:Transposase n=1 Tax=Streptomyces longisporus TaxID=1948 RepID=A0ABN3LGK0_STRLO